MKFSKKSRYGLAALIDLSVNSKAEQVALNSIAERNDISPQYLEQIFASLRRAGIVRSIKGPQGGYFLNKPTDKITVAEVVETLEGNYKVENQFVTVGNKQPEISDAIQHLVVDRVNADLENVLTNITLQDLEQNYMESLGNEQDMYYI
ncbi:MAG: Rrf2 family transcriptional regulator [Lachnospiraceae bacterium]|nr:Rrf2 family transcriptional regulator [Lachnospiraceae bacterium]